MSMELLLNLHQNTFAIFVQSPDNLDRLYTITNSSKYKIIQFSNNDLKSILIYLRYYKKLKKKKKKKCAAQIQLNSRNLWNKARVSFVWDMFESCSPIFSHNEASQRPQKSQFVYEKHQVYSEYGSIESNQKEQKKN